MRPSSNATSRREQRGGCEITASDGGFHGVGPAGLGPGARDCDARMAGALLRSRRADAGKPRCFGITCNRASDERCVFEGWEKRLHFAPGERFELRSRLAEILVGGAEAAAQIARLLFEDPLQRRLERRYEVAADAPAIVPKVDVDDRVGIVAIEVCDAVALRVAENSFRLPRRNGKHDRIEGCVTVRQAHGDSGVVWRY